MCGSYWPVVSKLTDDAERIVWGSAAYESLADCYDWGACVCCSISDVS